MYIDTVGIVSILIDVNKEFNVFSENDLEEYITKVLEGIEAGRIRHAFLDHGKGIVIGFKETDIYGKPVFQEHLVYILPEFRGNPRLFIQAVNILERMAKEEDCSSVIAGSSLNFRDSKILDVYQKKFGYTPYAVKKEL